MLYEVITITSVEPRALRDGAKPEIGRSSASTRQLAPVKAPIRGAASPRARAFADSASAKASTVAICRSYNFV